MNTVNNSYSDERPSLYHMKKCLEARMEQLAKEDICLAFSGGVDSSLLLKTAADAAAHTGRNVYAVTAGFCVCRPPASFRRPGDSQARGRGAGGNP